VYLCVRNYECQTYNSRGHTRGATQMVWTRPEDGRRKATQANPLTGHHRGEGKEGDPEKAGERASLHNFEKKN